jgi:hypothetical protein
MKRAIVRQALVALTIGLAAGLPASAGGQDFEADELVRVPSYAYGLDLEIWVDKGEAATYAEGREVKVRFRTDNDCYVVIYDIDTEGFLHLLYPDDPYDDGFVEGGRIYRLPGMGARYSLVAEGPPGIEYVAGVASYYPITRRLPWYLDDVYESAGYRGYHDIQATVDEVGAVRGDPFVAMRDIAYDILPERCTEEEYDTDYTYFHVSRIHSHPRYACYDCHGRASWFDPYDDVCAVVDIRVDLDWCFVRHPTIRYVGPRYWYWRRHDCPSFYISVPQFWCSLYPRNWFHHHFYFGLHRVGVWYERHGFWDPPLRYHGRPGVWGRGGYTGRYPDRPGYGKPPRHDVVNKGPAVSGARRHYARGDLPSGKTPEIRKPQRLGAPGGEKPKARTNPRTRGLKGSERGGVGGKDVDLRVKGEGSPDKPKARVSRRGDSGSQKTAPGVLRGKPGDRPKTKGEVRKAGPDSRSKAKVSGRGGRSPERSKARVVKPKSVSRSKPKAAGSKVKSGSRPESKPKAAGSKVKSGSRSKAKPKAAKSKVKSGSRPEAKPKAAKSKVKSGSRSKAKPKAAKSKASSGSKSRSKSQAGKSRSKSGSKRSR